jgi:hypothetical protein
VRRLICRTTLVSVGAATLFGMLQAAGGGVAAAHTPKAAAPRTSEHLVYRGTVNLRALATRPGSRRAALAGRYPAGRISPVHAKSAAAATVAAQPVAHEDRQ